MQHPAVVGAAAAHGVGAAQVLLRWALQQGIAVIPKSSSRGRIQSNSQLHGCDSPLSADAASASMATIAHIYIYPPGVCAGAAGRMIMMVRGGGLPPPLGLPSCGTSIHQNPIQHDSTIVVYPSCPACDPSHLSAGGPSARRRWPRWPRSSSRRSAAASAGRPTRCACSTSTEEDRRGARSLRKRTRRVLCRRDI
jgi:hypothetical protein